MTIQVGLIGVGLMGHGIARNILKAGFSLHFLEHAGNQPVDDLVAAGAVPCAQIQQVAHSANVLILCVTGAEQVQAILTGTEGALAALRPGCTVVDCSTSVPAVSKAMAELVAQVGGNYLDAPMTRTAHLLDLHQQGLGVMHHGFSGRSRADAIGAALQQHHAKALL